jgi:putative ABC transport system substrate-binding protein
LAKPGGNVTGLSIQAADLASKRLEILREVAPGVRRLVVMANAGNAQPVLEARETQAAACAHGFEVVSLEIRRAEDFAPALQALKADALYIAIDQLMVANRTRILTFALSARLPVITSIHDFVKDGALMSYGPSYPDLFRHSADFVDKILRGMKLNDIPNFSSKLILFMSDYCSLARCRILSFILPYVV